MKKTLIVILLGIMQCTFLLAQDLIEIKGNVTESGIYEPIPGVNVIVKGTTIGTITDIDGNYTIKAEEDATLLFSFIGMQSQEVVVKGQRNINVSMVADMTALDEVVAIGYGTARKRDLTGSIVNVSGEDLQGVPSNNPISGLTGKIAGVTITNSGEAGSSPNVLIRGVGTINSGTQPLYVVDGVFANDISFLNSNDIESIEVLKDASSLAIFGVQGANGVIIVTTKSAEVGKVNVSYNGYEGIQVYNKSDYIDMANASEFTELYNEFIRNSAIDNGDSEPDYWYGDLEGEGTNWQDLVLRQGRVRSHNITVSSGSDKGKSLFSFGYFKQEGVYKYDDYDRFNLRLKTDYNVGKHLKVGANIALIRISKTPSSNQLTQAVRSLPTYEPYDYGQSDQDEYRYDNNGELERNSNFPGNPGEIFSNSPDIAQQVGNPLANLELNKHNIHRKGYQAITSAYAEVTFLKNFKYRFSGSADYIFGSNGEPKLVGNAKSYRTKYHVSTMQNRYWNGVSRNSANNEAYQVDNLITYEKELGDHKITALAGLTYRETTYEGFSASADSLAILSPNATEDLQMLSLWSDKDKTGIGEGYDRSTFISYLARVNYSYRSKYLLNLTYRRDGSSKFDPARRYGGFGSVGAAWIVSEESFMDNLIAVDFLKVRASWGKIGNDKIGNYLHSPSVNPKGTQIIGADGNTYYLPTFSHKSSQPGWEVVEGIDVGVEAYLLGNKLNVDLGYYNKTTKDLLARITPKQATTFPYEVTNMGDMRNSGVELVLGWNDNIGNLSYSVSANASYLKNEITMLPEGRPVTAGPNAVYVSRVGDPFASILGFEQEGIYQDQNDIDNSPDAKYGVVKPGDMKYKDTNGDGVVDNNDRKLLGNYLPDFAYGINLNLEYKGFDFALEMNGVEGVKIYNTMMEPSTFAQFNYHNDWLNRWTGPGTSNTVPIASFRSTNYLPSSFFVHSGDYFRIRNIQLGYNLPKSLLSKIDASSMRIYLNAQNPFTFNNYIGFTPEFNSGQLTPGYDTGNKYPNPATYTIGLNVNF